MKLCYANGTIAVASIIALKEAGIAFEPVRIDFASAEQTKPTYHEINPKGRVPALIDGDRVLTETGAVLEYIATLAPDAGLVPAYPWQAAQMRALMYYLASTMHVNHAHKMRGSRWANEQSSFDDMKAKVPENMATSAAYVESQIVGPFTMGERVTLADPYLFAICRWLKGDGVEIADYPKLATFFDAMNKRESVKSAEAEGLL